MRRAGRSQSSGRNSRGHEPDKPALNIAAVLYHYGFNFVPENRSQWVKLKCDFHGETQASATVNTDLGAFNCFACGMTGDTLKILKLAEEREGRPGDFPSVLKKYKEITGEDVPFANSNERPQRQRNTSVERASYETGSGMTRRHNWKAGNE